MFNLKSKRNIEYVIEAFENRKYLTLPRLIQKTRRINLVNHGLEKHLSKKEVISAIKKAEKKGFIINIPDLTCKLYTLGKNVKKIFSSL